MLLDALLIFLAIKAACALYSVVRLIAELPLVVRGELPPLS